MVSFILTISFTLLIIRLIQYFHFENQRRNDRSKLSPFKTVQVGSRNVDIYVSSQFSGTPFTGGVIKPYICLPEDATQKLTPEEMDAVIAHELGHVRYYDLIATGGLQRVHF